MTTVILKGVLKSKIQWVTANWDRMIRAHRDEVPDIETFTTGTFNIALLDPSVWNPPNDEVHRRNSHEKGLRLGCNFESGADFLRCGNYIHPQISVTSINGLPLAGRVYYPGIDETKLQAEGLPEPIDRQWLEILSKDNLRRRLNMSDLASDHPCEVVLSITAAE